MWACLLMCCRGNNYKYFDSVVENKRKSEKEDNEVVQAERSVSFRITSDATWKKTALYGGVSLSS